jgi:acyl-CoA synthetase (AMP-forming)/AMP-acid ligase II
MEQRAAPPDPLTYAELGERVARIAAGLLERGVGRGRRGRLPAAQLREFTALFYACNRIAPSPTADADLPPARAAS